MYPIFEHRYNGRQIYVDLGANRMGCFIEISDFRSVLSYQRKQHILLEFHFFSTMYSELNADSLQKCLNEKVKFYAMLNVCAYKQQIHLPVQASFVYT